MEGRSKGLLTEHNLMLHLLRDPDKRIDTYLKALKLDRQEFVTHLTRTQEEKADQDAEAPKQAFSDYVEDMNAKARAGEIHHIQGRQNDMQWLLNTLCQYKKKNAILIGPPGVGKTALIEELALRIEEGTVPEQLKGKTVYSLDVGGHGCRNQASGTVRGAHAEPDAISQANTETSSSSSTRFMRS